MKRRIYHVVLRGKEWHVRRTQARRASGCHIVKRAAIAHARQLAIHPNCLGQVVVHGKDGKVQREWTYGADPRRTRG